MAAPARSGWAIAVLFAAALVAVASQWAFARAETAYGTGIILFLLVFPLTWSYARLEDGCPALRDDPLPPDGVPEPILTPAHLVTAQGRTFAATLSLFALAGCVALAGREGANREKVLLLLAAVVLFLVACRPPHLLNTMATVIRGLRTHWLEAILVTVIISAGAFARLYRLDAYPFGMHGDEGEFGSAALRLMDGEPLEIFSSGVFLQHPNVYAFLLAGSMRLFGEDFAGARVFSGLAGSATVLALYAMVRTMFGARAAVPAAALFALAPWHLTFSRMAMNDVLVPLFLTLTILFLYRGLRSHAVSDYALAGMSCGLGWWMDYNNKSVILCLVVAGSVLYLVATRWRRWRSELVMVGVFAAGVLVVMAPVLAASFLNEQLLRFAEVARESSFVLHPAPPDEPLPYATALLLAGNKIARTTFAFNYFGDMSPFNVGNATPVFDYVTAVCFFVGLAYALWRWREARYGLLALWWGLALLPDIWALDPPQGHHLFPAVVPAYALAAVGLTKIAGAWAAALQWSRPVYVAATTAILVGVISYLNATRYFFPPSPDRSWVFYVEVGRAIRELAPNHSVYFLGPPAVYSGHGTIRFASHEAPVTDIENVREVVPVRQPGVHDLYFLFSPSHFEDLGYVRECYPHGSLKEWRDDGSEPYLMGYEVSREDAEEVISNQ